MGNNSKDGPNSGPLPWHDGMTACPECRGRLGCKMTCATCNEYNETPSGTRPEPTTNTKESEVFWTSISKEHYDGIDSHDAAWCDGFDAGRMVTLNERIANRTLARHEGAAVAFGLMGMAEAIRANPNVKACPRCFRAVGLNFFTGGERGQFICTDCWYAGKKRRTNG